MRTLTVALVLVGSIARAMVLNTIDSINATVLSGTSVRVDWTDNATNSAGYRIERCSSNCGLITGSWTLVGINGPGVESFTDTGLSTGTQYTWRISEDPFMVASATPTSTTVTTTVTTTTTTGSVTTTTLSSGLIGFIPGIGAAQDVISTGNNIFVASYEFGFVTATVSPWVAIGATKTPFSAQVAGSGFAVSGSVAIAHDRTSQVRNSRILDISNLTNPVQVATIIGNFEGHAIVGTKLYSAVVVAGNPGTSHFYSHNISNPSSPTQLSDLTISSAGSVRCVGVTCYVAEQGFGFGVINISSTPSLVTTIDTPGTVSDLYIVSAENKLYVADGTSLRIYDISTPTAPSLVGTLTTSVLAVSAKAGGTVIAVDGQNMKTIDASTASAPLLKATVPNLTGIHVALNGNTAYLVEANASSYKGLLAYNVSNLTSPTLIGNLYGGQPSQTSISVNTSTNIAAVAGAGNSITGAKIVDISTPSAPVLRSTYTNGAGRNMNGSGISGSNLFTVELTPGNPGVLKFLSLNISDPSNPTLSGFVQVPGAASYPIKIVGSKAYVSMGLSGVDVINFSNLSSPYIEGSYDSPGTAAGIDIVGNTLYLADTTAIITLDISGSGNPVQRGSAAISCLSISVVNNVAWCIDGLNLRKVNVTNITSPTLLSTVDSHQAIRVIANGTRVYGTAPFVNHGAVNQGLQVWNWDGTASTATPTFVRQIPSPGSPNAGLAFGPGNLVLTGDFNGILSIFSP